MKMYQGPRIMGHEWKNRKVKHDKIMGLGQLSPFYTDAWNSRVIMELRAEGVQNIAYYDSFRAIDYVPKSFSEVYNVFQFEQIDRKCHRCQLVKSELWYTPIKNGDMQGTPEEASTGILNAIARNAFCANCAGAVGL